jgi:multiple sugar transport system permease protein
VAVALRRWRARGPEAREARLAFWMLLPAVAGLLAISVYPVAQTVVWSFQHLIVTEPDDIFFDGLHNYQRLVADPDFWTALRFTALYTVCSVAGQFVVGLVLALTAHREFRGRGLVRAAMLFPWAMPTVITAEVWRFMYLPDYGVINGTLQHLGLPHEIVWLGQADLAVIALLILAVWKVNSFVALVLLAGLQAIPRDVYEAASVDGAGFWRQLWSITIPYLRPAIMVVLVLRTVESLQAFDIIYGLTQGGPAAATKNLPLYLYEQAFQGLNFGYGSALAVALSILILACAVVYVRLLYREETYG